MRLSDIQPQYFPRLHYIARMLASDVFVLRDEVQFVRKHRYPDGSNDVSYQAHTPIQGPDGRHLLGVATKSDGRRPIRLTLIDPDQPWAGKHMRTIRSFYGSSPQFRTLFPELERLLSHPFATIAELDIATLCWALGHLLGEVHRVPEDLSLARINELLAARRTVRLRRIVRGSDHPGSGADEPLAASERTVALCRMFGADEYMGGRTAVLAYLDTALFRRAGIALKIQDWSCVEYPQQHTARAGFLRDLSILDLLMNVPAEKAMSIVSSACQAVPPAEPVSLASAQV